MDRHPGAYICSTHILCAHGGPVNMCCCEVEQDLCGTNCEQRSYKYVVNGFDTKMKHM